MSDKQKDLMQVIMGLIMHGGDAKSHAMEAIHYAKNEEFEKAKSKIQMAQEAISQAHQFQTQLLTEEAGGENFQVSLMLVHGQDHLMNALTFIDLAKEVIELYERIGKNNEE